MFTIENVKSKFQKKNIHSLLEDTDKYNKKIKKNISKQANNLLKLEQYATWFEDKNKVPKLRLTRNVSKQKKALKFS
jgi:hypothetical protein